ncbi:MAG: ferredoxin family protein [Bacteroidales bacterium]
MKLLFFNRAHNRTPFIYLDTRKCKACWECLMVCPSKVIGKIDLPWHKHALITKSSACLGCFKCVRICKFDAYTAIKHIK